MVLATGEAHTRPAVGRAVRPSTRLVAEVVCVLPAVVVLIGGWVHRWMNEDAFINLRIVDQIFAGNGPVFNAGERVEAFTSPVWLAALVLGRATLGAVMEMEWVAVVASLACATAAFVIAGRASRLAHAEDGIVVPLGIGVVAAVPVVWDFATSGLENGLAWLWLAGCWWTLLVAARASTEPTRRSRVFAAALLGLGPLVRPDLMLMSVCVLVAWFAIRRAPARVIVVDTAAALALPLVYQIFRMGYYASLVPNTALAKDADGIHFAEGRTYAWDLVEPYALWLPLLLVTAVLAVQVARGTRGVRIASAGMATAALVHAAYIVAVGGDYMHGRLLLPALFAFALPASLVLRGDRAAATGVVVVCVAWAVVSASALRYENPRADAFTVVLSDWRALTVPPRVVQREVPGDLSGESLARRYDRGERGLIGLVAPGSSSVARQGSDPDVLAVVGGSMGLWAYRAGTDVFVIDFGGLAEPLAARTSPIAGRAAGHRKNLQPGWYEARFLAEDLGAGDESIEAAERALSCAPLDDLLDAISEPLTPGRFLANIVDSPGFTRLHVPADPKVAPEELC
jgi:arabinofuranosyltransferase